MNKDLDWNNIQAKGKRHFVFVSSFQTALFYVLVYGLINAATNYYRGRFSSSIPFSGIVLDYVLELMFWLIVIWMGIAFFRWLIWHKQENG